MAQCAKKLVQRERHSQLTWKAIDINIARDVLIQDFIMVTILEGMIVKVTCLDGVLAIEVQCGPLDQTKKVLNLGNQQRSDLQEDTKICGLFYGLIFHLV